MTAERLDQSGPEDDGEFVYIDIGSVDNDSKRITGPKRLHAKAAPSRARQRLCAGDVLVSMTRPNLNAVAIVPSQLDGAICSTGFHVLRSTGVEPRWLFYAVQTQFFVGQMSALVQGALYPAIRPKDVRGFRVPVPPLEEQRRIVAAIEEHLSDLEAAVAGLKRARANVARYRVSVITAGVTGRFVGTSGNTASSANSELPSHWAWVELRQLGEIKGGLTKGQRRRAGDVLRSVPYLRVANVQRGFLDLAEVKEIEATEADIQDLRLRPGDVLFNEGGDRDKLGRGWVWAGELPECIHQNHVFRARFDQTRVEPKFVSFYANTLGQRYFLAQGRQTTNLASINLTKLGALPVPLPPVEEQRAIVEEIHRRLAVADRTAGQIDIQLARAARLRQAILKRAFEGKLAPQDPDDEPAHVLLERICAERATGGGKATGARSRRAAGAVAR